MFSFSRAVIDLLCRELKLSESTGLLSLRASIPLLVQRIQFLWGLDITRLEYFLIHWSSFICGAWFNFFIFLLLHLYHLGTQGDLSLSRDLQKLSLPSTAAQICFTSSVTSILTYEDSDLFLYIPTYGKTLFLEAILSEPLPLLGSTALHSFCSVSPCPRWHALHCKIYCGYLFLHLHWILSLNHASK